MKKHFNDLAHGAATWVGSPTAFALSVFGVLIWAVLGPVFNYSDTWQLIINTATTVITFLMVFLIQNTQNRDARAIHMKLDELIRASSHARNRLIDLQSMTDAELDVLHAELCKAKKTTEAHLEDIENHKKDKHTKRVLRL